MIIGALVHLWVYADTHLDQEDLLAMGVIDVDKLVGIDDFCDIMPPKWLEIIDRDSCVKLPGYQAHNGSYERKKSLSALRMKRYRERQQNTGNDTVTRNSDAVTPVRPRLRSRPKQEKEEEQEQKAAAPPVVQPRKQKPPDFDPSTVPNLHAESWRQWLTYRAERKPAIKPASMRAAAEELAAFGELQAAVVKHSMANGYQGLFAPKANGQHQRAPPVKYRTADEIEAEERARGDWDAQH
jgi:hypothetical protein